jgi:hypothetical protein
VIAALALFLWQAARERHLEIQDERAHPEVLQHDSKEKTR